MNKIIKIGLIAFMMGTGLFLVNAQSEARRATATCLDKGDHAGYCKVIGLRYGQSKVVDFESAKRKLEAFYRKNRVLLAWSHMTGSGDTYYWVCVNRPVIRFRIHYTHGVCSSAFNGKTVNNLTGSERLCSVGTTQNFQTTDDGWRWKCKQNGLSNWCSANKTCGQCKIPDPSALCGGEGGFSPECVIGSRFVINSLTGPTETPTNSDIYHWNWQCSKNSCDKDCNATLNLSKANVDTNVADTDAQGQPIIRISDANNIDEPFTVNYTVPEPKGSTTCRLTGVLDRTKAEGGITDLPNFPKAEIKADGSVNVTATETGEYKFTLDCSCAQGTNNSIDVSKDKTVKVTCEAEPSAWSACSSSCQGTKTREVTDSWTCTKSSETIKCGDENCEGGTIEK